MLTTMCVAKQEDTQTFCMKNMYELGSEGFPLIIRMSFSSLYFIDGASTSTVQSEVCKV